MMSSRFLPVSFLATVMFLSSCGGNEEKTSTDKMGADTVLLLLELPHRLPQTIVATPQAVLVDQH